ncbi:MAG: type II toxin-antitoxin system ParD family antitoxin [Alphaproteobacteria bacterium]|nr:type II toxin-antitoxin system ParD family antitoxin [Alphaproteobacteria bacterium]
MSYAVGDHFESFIKKQVSSGRYNNASEVVREGLRLVEEREEKLRALRFRVQSAVEQGGSYTDDELDVILSSEAQ